MMELGLRVVRGPDWKWDMQDDGEGHAGTVVEIGKVGSCTSPDKTVVVEWDCGTRTNYRTGYQGAYDLLVFDNAPSGTKHPNIICDGCARHGIQGMRWKCVVCEDFDLCSACYFNDKHDVMHKFMRFISQNAVGVPVTPRKNATKKQVRGLFPGARVVRGGDWDWGNQDGGDGKAGKITDIRGWDIESGRSVASVTWESGGNNVYRVGHKGKVDLKYIEDGIGGFYYKEHLPRLGEMSEMALGATGDTSKQTFNVGDKVKVVLEREVLKVMQEGHGGWNSKMADYIGKVGFVHRVTDRGDIRVQYPTCGTRWTFHPGSLTKVDVFAVGDFVRLLSDQKTVKKLQAGHGEWSANMKETLGKVGKVLRVYTDGDLRISVDGQAWTFNPACAKLEESARPDHNNTMMPDSDREDEHPGMHLLLDQIISLPTAIDSPEKLISEAAQGNAHTVVEILAKHPEWVDTKNSGKSALQVASHQGHLEVVKALVVCKANLELQDQDGDTALHYAIFGNQPDVTQYLLSKGAKINAVNQGHCSSLHVAVNKSYAECVRVLLRHKCDVNLQDSYGDTALHDAIAKDNKDIIDLLVSAQGADFTLKNQRGFNVLHHASLKGNKYATQKIVTKARQLVNVKKDDGFAALHLAALNGHRDVADTLITLGQCEVDIQNNRRQTPLLLAVGQGHSGVIDLFVAKGADVNTVDEDGDSCLHLALLRQNVYTTTSPELLALLKPIVPANTNDMTPGAAVACFLVKSGADLNLKNQQGKTALELMPDEKTGNIIKQFVEARQKEMASQAKVKVRTPKPGSAASMGRNQPNRRSKNLEAMVKECRMCSKPPDCMFHPCGHQASCMDCAKLFQKCFVCKADVKSYVKKESAKCCACKTKPVEVVMEPCGHKSLCQDCAMAEVETECSICKSSQTELIAKGNKPNIVNKPRKGSSPAALKSGFTTSPRGMGRKSSDGVTGLSMRNPLGKGGRKMPTRAKSFAGTALQGASGSGQPSESELRQLKEKMREMEEAQLCTICMERRRDTVFLCGHTCCKKCSKSLKHCPMCRKAITKKINMFT